MNIKFSTSISLALSGGGIVFLLVLAFYIYWLYRSIGFNSQTKSKTATFFLVLYIAFVFAFAFALIGIIFISPIKEFQFDVTLSQLAICFAIPTLFYIWLIIFIFAKSDRTDSSALPFIYPGYYMFIRLICCINIALSLINLVMSKSFNSFFLSNYIYIINENMSVYKTLKILNYVFEFLSYSNILLSLHHTVLPLKFVGLKVTGVIDRSDYTVARDANGKRIYYDNKEKVFRDSPGGRILPPDTIKKR